MGEWPSMGYEVRLDSFPLIFSHRKRISERKKKNELILINRH